MTLVQINAVYTQSSIFQNYHQHTFYYKVIYYSFNLCYLFLTLLSLSLSSQNSSLKIIIFPSGAWRGFPRTAGQLTWPLLAPPSLCCSHSPLWQCKREGSTTVCAAAHTRESDPGKNITQEQKIAILTQISLQIQFTIRTNSERDGLNIITAERNSQSTGNRSLKHIGTESTLEQGCSARDGILDIGLFKSQYYVKWDIHVTRDLARDCAWDSHLCTHIWALDFMTISSLVTEERSSPS